MKTRKILITGANGFVGSRLVKHANNINLNIRVISRKSSDIFESIVCDFLKNTIPENALHSIDTVFHIAGFAHDFRSTDDLALTYEAINVNASVQLAKLAIKNKVKTFVFVSSVKAGGLSDQNICMNELNQKNPDGVYGQSKRDAELQLLKLSKNSDMKLIIVRPSLVYGKGMKGNLNLMLAGIKSGWFPPLPKIVNRRSMIHVDDLVNALIMLSSAPIESGEVFIATDGHPYSSREIYEVMCNILGKKIPKWSIPLWVFAFVSIFNKGIKYKINKLFGNEWYSSEKLESLGFKAKKSLHHLDENETFN